jgi:hypothetical protein
MERRELETAAARATYLRGLTAVPLGVLFLLTGLGNLGWRPMQSPVVFLACLAVLAALYAGIMRYYNVHYGRVRLEKRQQRRFTLLCFGCFGTALVGGSTLDYRLDLPVSLFVISFAIAMLVWFGICVGLRRDHLVVWGALIVVGLVPVWGGPADNTSAGWLPIGVATIVAGILDHRALVRSFGSGADIRVGA